MAKLQDFNRVVEKYSDLADFLVVYVQEAHATDEWSVNNNYDIR